MLETLIPVINALLVINIALVSGDIRTWLINHLAQIYKSLIKKIAQTIDENYELCNMNPQLTLDSIPPEIIQKYENLNIDLNDKILNTIPMIGGACFCFSILLIDGLYNVESLDCRNSGEIILLSYAILIIGHCFIVRNPFKRSTIFATIAYLCLTSSVIVFFMGYNLSSNLRIFINLRSIDETSTLNLIPIFIILLTAISPILYTGYYIVKVAKVEDTNKLKDKVNKCDRILELNQNEVGRGRQKIKDDVEKAELLKGL